MKCEVSSLAVLAAFQKDALLFIHFHLGVSKNNRGKNPKMDGENHGKPYLNWMIWGENPLFSGNTHLSSNLICRISQDRK